MQELIPITLFICTAYAIHAIADARARSKLVAPHVPEEVIRSLALLEEERRRQGALPLGHQPGVSGTGHGAAGGHRCTRPDVRRRRRDGRQRRPGSAAGLALHPPRSAQGLSRRMLRAQEEPHA